MAVNSLKAFLRYSLEKERVLVQRKKKIIQRIVNKEAQVMGQALRQVRVYNQMTKHQEIVFSAKMRSVCDRFLSSNVRIMAKGWNAL